MARILTVGIATWDWVYEVKSYPQEDDEIRALSLQKRRGGNAANTATRLQRLGHQLAWAGSLPDNPEGHQLAASLEADHIQVLAQWHPQGQVPTSQVILSQDSGSRTIIHYRDLAEYEGFEAIDIQAFDWIHFEGRHLPALGAMLRRCQQAGIPCSLEIEKARSGIEALWSIPQLLLFSKAYVQQQSSSPKAFLQALPSPSTAALAWGAEGAWGRKGQNIIFRPAPKIKVVDSLGAGDVFNAGMIHAQLSCWDLSDGLDYSIQLAAQHCAQLGL